MSLDAICLRAVLSELRQELTGARIDKVQQPARDQIVLLLRGNRRVLLSANPNQPRIQLTNQVRENPSQPPMFCMLLRKHLVGARIVSAEQPDLERIVILTFHVVDSLGDDGKRRLVLEAMGRRANLLLLDGEGRIIDGLRRVALDPASGRAVLPGLYYHFPNPLAKLSLLSEPDAALALVRNGGGGEELVDQWLVGHLAGLSPLIARELVQRAAGTTDLRFGELNAGQRNCLLQEVQSLIDLMQTGAFKPTMLLRGGSPADYTYMDITQYGAETAVEQRNTFTELLDEYYELRERRELALRRGKELSRAAAVARDRMARKLETLKTEYEATKNRDVFRLYGDLITANIFRIERGCSALTAENYYEAGQPGIRIPLDPLLTPQQNAARYYKRYRKLKSAEAHLKEQIERTRIEKTYLESVLQEIEQAETETEFQDIRREMQENGFLRRGKEKKEFTKNSKPREYRSSGGLRILVGRNNIQNDYLTRRADKRDIWFHAQKIHGSHVILCTNGAEPDENSLSQAALLAAYFSQARESARVPVDYTAVKNVKKPGGARPGMVVYDAYRTVYVTPGAGNFPAEEGKR